MPIRIALAGNPNSGKTTLFNGLTGSNQYVGNWPGVTVEKKEGKLKGHTEVSVVDLPGIYSLSPYTLEEVVSRNYLVDERPEVILNIVDGTNLERNLFLTTQLTELGIPVVVAINMIDVLQKRGDTVITSNLEKALGCRVVEVSALKGTGMAEAAEAALAMAEHGRTVPRHSFSGSVEHTIAHIEEAVLHSLPEEQQRWYAIKLFERDERIAQKLGISMELLAHIERDIIRCETELDDDSESIITTERYNYIDSIIKDCRVGTRNTQRSVSERIDRVVTNRVLALPIFAVVMFLVYYVSVSTVGALATDWANEGVFGEGWHLFGIGADAYDTAVAEYHAARLTRAPDPSGFGVWVPGVPVIIGGMLEAVGCAEWLRGLILDGMVAGVGAVLGFVPQIFILFIFLAFLEGCGYMARIAFILDRIFAKFGLSGKSFIPILIGTGCGVPGIMASRTIENGSDRRMTVITTTFIPCSAKLPIISLFASAVFKDAWWVAPSAYFIGIAAVICSGVILKKMKPFSSEAIPFVMELPAYHWPTAGSILRSTWERGWSFIKKAFTIILLATVVVWFVASFGFVDGVFTMVAMPQSILATVGGMIAWVFAPLGWGDWKFAVATVTGLIGKETIVGTFGILFAAEGGAQLWSAAGLSALSAYSFLVFNLLCAPCFAAMGAIRREMNDMKWFMFAVGYQCGLAYAAALCVYQLGLLAATGAVGAGTLAAVVLVFGFLWGLLKRERAG